MKKINKKAVAIKDQVQKVIDINKREDLNRLNELSEDLQLKINELIDTVAGHKYDPSVEKFVTRHISEVRHTLTRSKNLVGAVNRCGGK